MGVGDGDFGFIIPPFIRPVLFVRVGGRTKNGRTFFCSMYVCMYHLRVGGIDCLED